MNRTMLLGALLLAACAGGASGNPDSSPGESSSGDALPRLINRELLERLVERQYPPVLRGAGIGGDVVVWLSLDSEGAVQEVLVKESSGYPGLDEVAVRISRRLRFTPALNNGNAVPAEVAVTVAFRAGGGPVPVPET